MIYTLNKEQVVNCDLEEAWNFFSTPKNLSLITPPDMSFEIISEVPEEIYNGLEIDYKVRPFSFYTTRWKSEISEVIDKKLFVDRQLSGPYKYWKHTHYFEPIETSSVLMTDIVEYALPFGKLGGLAHRLFVKRKLDAIFEYRYREIEKIFAT